MNREIRQASAQIHVQSRLTRRRADQLGDPWFQATVVNPLRNLAELYGSR
jgi:hypothetical protein